MFSYYLLDTKNSDSSSENYIHVNNLGYYEDLTDMKVYREKGRLDYQLIYVKSGEIVIHEQDEDVALTDGTICLFRPKEAQIYNTYKKPTTFFWIHFSGREAEQMLGFFEKRAYYIGAFPEFEYYCHGSSSNEGITKKYIDLLYEGRLIALIARIAERVHSDGKSARDMLKIRPALDAMRSDRQPKYSNEELSALCGISKYYFLKIFKNVMGVTPQQYYVTLTVDKGRYLLTNTSYNIGEISTLCGIEDSFYFSRIFKKHVGLSPKNYREKFAGK